MEHTPGPWAVGWHDRGHGHGDYAVMTESDIVIAKVETGLIDDALVLAAAPNLLEACKRLRRRAKTGRPITFGDVDVLDTAIAKAKPKGE